MFPEQVQYILQYATLAFGVIALIVTLKYFWSGQFILSAPLFQAAHYIAFLAVRIYTRARGMSYPDLFNDWSTLLRLHATITLLTLTIYIITCRKHNGHTRQ